MASSKAMAQCLTADAKLMTADMDSEQFEEIRAMAADVVDSVTGAVAEMGRPVSDATVILMLAAASALGVDDGAC